MATKFRRIAIVVIVVFSGVVALGSEQISMLATAVRMLTFYDVSILVGS